MATFPASRLANGGLPGTSRSKHYGSRIGHIYYIGRHAVQTPSMREWSTALSQLYMSLISYSPGHGLLELFRGKLAPTHSVSPVDMSH